MSIFTKRRQVRLSKHHMAASPFGPIRVSYDGGPSVIALVQGPGIPPVTVLPGGGMSVDGQRVPMRKGAGRGWDPRRVARTSTVLVGDRSYELRPTRLFQSRLLRNGTLIAEAHGTLRSYSPFRSIPDIDAILTWSYGVTPQTSR